MTVQEFYHAVRSFIQHTSEFYKTDSETDKDLVQYSYHLIVTEIERIENGGEVVLYQENGMKVSLCCDNKKMRIKKQIYIDEGGVSEDIVNRGTSDGC